MNALLFAIALLSTSFVFMLPAHSLVRLPALSTDEPVRLLSQTGLFQTPVKELKPIDKVIPYEINQALFVDFAVKKRWIYIPEGEMVKFHPTESYEFPVGTAMIKHFSMEISHGVFQKLETRVLLLGKDKKWIGFTYLWKDDDAHLVKANEAPQVPLTVDATAKGGARSQVFKVPSRQQCLDCHNVSVGFARSFRTFQLNKELSGKNQLHVLQEKGVITKNTNVDQWPRLANLEDELAPIEERAKAYLSVNCAHCHNPDDRAMCSFVGIDFRYNHFNVENLINEFQIIPGSKERSSVHRRMNRVGFGRMPLFGADLRDPKAIEVIGRWIDQMQP